MTDYKFDWINGNVTIINPTVTWEEAGFRRGNNPLVTLDIRLTNDSVNCIVQLSVSKEAIDRSDEAIDALMIILLEPYKQ